MTYIWKTGAARRIPSEDEVAEVAEAPTDESAGERSVEEGDTGRN